MLESQERMIGMADKKAPTSKTQTAKTTGGAKRKMALVSLGLIALVACALLGGGFVMSHRFGTGAQPHTEDLKNSGDSLAVGASPREPVNEVPEPNAVVPKETSNAIPPVGASESDKQNIYGGQTLFGSQLTWYPYVVRITITTASSSWVCTGTILSNKFVITRYNYCIRFRSYNQVSIRAGPPGAYQTRSVHSWTNNLDAALVIIRIKGWWSFNSDVNRVRRWSSHTGSDSYPKTAGWGRIWQNGPYTTSLKRITGMHFTHCPWPKLCTTGGNGRTCQGDYGAPLMWRYNPGGTGWKDYLVGIDVYSSGSCNVLASLDVYERVGLLSTWHWMARTIGKYHCWSPQVLLGASPDGRCVQPHFTGGFGSCTWTRSYIVTCA